MGESGKLSDKTHGRFQTSKTPVNQRSVGKNYEKLAADYLRSEGYEILQMNYRCRLGEIDIVAKDGGYLVFTEVKYRSDFACGEPKEAVDFRKQKVICRVAQYYCLKYGLSEVTPCRFDVVAICADKIELIKNAFDFIS